MNKRNEISLDEARRIGDCLYVDWEQVDLDRFRLGLMGKRPQRDRGAAAGLAYDGVVLSGRTVLAHMRQIPDYVVRLAKLRAEVRQYEDRRRRQNPEGALATGSSSERAGQPGD